METLIITAFPCSEFYCYIQMQKGNDNNDILY